MKGGHKTKWRNGWGKNKMAERKGERCNEDTQWKRAGR